jgi:hypothetical protein
VVSDGVVFFDCKSEANMEPVPVVEETSCWPAVSLRVEEDLVWAWDVSEITTKD